MTTSTVLAGRAAKPPVSAAKTPLCSRRATTTLTHMVPRPEATAKPRLILEHAQASHDAFKKAVEILKKERGGKRGMTTDEEQDILRASVVFAAAGLDAVAKQLIRDAVPALLDSDPKVLDGLETFVSRRIRGEDEEGEGFTRARFLARLLTAKSSREQVIEEYVRELTGSSLQSAEELYKTASALGLDAAKMNIDRKTLQPIFECRNKIIHELDIDLSGTRRKRNIRSEDQMIEYATTLLDVAARLINGVEERLRQAA